MIPADIELIIEEVRKAAEDITKYAADANAEALLQCYCNTSEFMAVTSDGRCMNYEDFKQLCKEYYQWLQEQQISTMKEIYFVIDSKHVLLTWTGNIVAYFTNGDIFKMNCYTVTSLFKKVGGGWKVIHSQESSFPFSSQK